MPQSATVARALRLITESSRVVHFCQCLTLRPVTGAAREALRGIGLLLVGEKAAADCEGTACCKTSDERCAVLLACVEGGGIARATQKGLFLYYPQEKH